jgi:periplasmic mercuric ion binding protein
MNMINYLKMGTKLICLFGFLLTLTSACAQNQNNPPKKGNDTISFVVGMHCESCKERIEHYLPMEKGVEDLIVNLDQKEVTVIYKPTKTNADKLKKAIEEIGYSCEEKHK